MIFLDFRGLLLWQSSKQFSKQRCPTTNKVNLSSRFYTFPGMSQVANKSKPIKFSYHQDIGTEPCRIDDDQTKKNPHIMCPNDFIQGLSIEEQ